MSVAVATLVAALGLVVHNVLSLPIPLQAPENIGPVAVYAALLGWMLLGGGGPARVAMLAWAVLALVGGAIVSVLPLPFLPFMPEQTAAHYVAHVIYGLSQVPLIVTVWRAGARGTMAAISRT